MRQNLFQKISGRLKKLRVHLSDNQTIVLLIAVVLLVLTNLAVLMLLIFPDRNHQTITPTSSVVQQITSSEPATPTPPQGIVQADVGQQLPPVGNFLEGSSLRQGTIIFSMVEDGYSHLFAFSPGDPVLLRLTNNPWDDSTPQMDPTGRLLAYSSQKNGYWDIYILDLQTGISTAITDTGDYDTHPSWSPDGTRLVFQSYIGGNSEILLANLTSQPYEITRLTMNDFEDYDPDWSPNGDQIIYVGAYNNTPRLWMVTFIDNQIQVEPLGVKSGYDPRNPVWSPDGSSLAWSEMIGNRRTIMTWENGQVSEKPEPLSEGDFPAWSQDGSILFNIIPQPNQTYLSANSLPYGNLVYPVTPTSGMVENLVWSKTSLPSPVPDWITTLQTQSLDPIFLLAITPPADNMPDRYQVVPVPNVKAPFPMLHDLTDESFIALRERVKVETGWDVLANLENAFLPISEVANPNLQENWLYTGRAFSLNTIPMNLDWMFITHETYGDQSYFHMYVRPIYQDGSMGKPVLQKAWDINARFTNDPAAYEDGGMEMDSYSEGYWVDLTDLALRYGWERIEASPNWTTYYQGARFNLFALRSGLNWKDAMLELYPLEVFITPTPLAAPTITLTPTRRLIKTLTPTITPSPTTTSTRRPTWTPLP